MTELLLTDGDLQRLDELEETIERGLATFIDVGNALLVIREGRLYRGEYGTFEDYCRERWEISRAHAYRMIQAAEIVSPIGDAGLPAPSNEGQARELGRVPEEERAGVWEETLGRTNGKPTASAIRETREERRQPEPPEPEPLPDLPPPAPEPEPDKHAERLARLRQMADEAERADPYVPIRELVEIRDALRRAIPKMRALRDAGQGVGADGLTAGIASLWKELEELL